MLDKYFYVQQKALRSFQKEGATLRVSAQKAYCFSSRHHHFLAVKGTKNEKSHSKQPHGVFAQENERTISTLSVSPEWMLNLTERSTFCECHLWLKFNCESWWNTLYKWSTKHVWASSGDCPLRETSAVTSAVSCKRFARFLKIVLMDLCCMCLMKQKHKKTQRQCVWWSSPEVHSLWTTCWTYIGAVMQYTAVVVRHLVVHRLADPQELCDEGKALVGVLRVNLHEVIAVGSLVFVPEAYHVTYLVHWHTNLKQNRFFFVLISGKNKCCFCLFETVWTKYNLFFPVFLLSWNLSLLGLLFGKELSVFAHKSEFFDSDLQCAWLTKRENEAKDGLTRVRHRRMRSTGWGVMFTLPMKEPQPTFLVKMRCGCCGSM